MYVPRSLLCLPQGVCEAGRGTPGRGGISAASPGVIPGAAGADGSSSKGESSSLSRGRRGGPGGSLSSWGRSVQESGGDARPQHRCGGAELALEKVTLSPPDLLQPSPKGCW